MASSPLISNPVTPKKNHQEKTPMGQTNRQSSRIAKAYNILDHVHKTTDTTAMVLSSDSKTEYYVTLSPADGKHICTCPDSSIRGNICKHCIAFITFLNEPVVKEIELPPEHKIIDSSLLQE